MHVFGRTRRVDHANPSRILFGEREKASTNALVKRDRLAFETIDRFRASPPKGARKTDLDRAIEHEREIRQQSLSGEELDASNLRDRKLSTVCLIRERRVREAITEHDLSGAKRRLNQAFDVLGAVGEDQEELREGAEPGPRVKEKRANLGAELRPARLAGDADGDLSALERGREEADLRRLASAFDAFDRDEQRRDPTGCERRARSAQEASFPSKSRMPFKSCFAVKGFVM